MSFIKIFHTSSDNIHQVWAAPQKLLGTGEEGKCEYKGVKIRSSVSVSASAFCFVLCGCVRPSVRPSLNVSAVWNVGLPDVNARYFHTKETRWSCAALLWPRTNCQQTTAEPKLHRFRLIVISVHLFCQNYIKLSNSVLLLQFRVFFSKGDWRLWKKC